MSQNQEVIEAKLCAYIDGELDLEGRSEIERHLEANPQHRRLLESLKATKDLVRWLPREPAPPEVAETLNGQLERSVLLDYDGDSLRPNFLPRFLAAAAIVGLTVGLAAAVYFALPKSQKNATPYAFHPSDGPSTITPVPSVTETVTESEKSGEGMLAKKEGSRTLAESTMNQQAIAQTPTDLPPNQPASDLDRLVQDVAQNRAVYVAAANSANQSPRPIAGNAMVMLVRSDSPQQTEKQLTVFLNSQNIQWKQAPVAQEAGTQKDEQLLRRSNWSETPGQLAGTAGSQSVNKSDARGAETQPAQQNSITPTMAGVYVARMSRQQAEELNTTISRDGAQFAELKGVDPATKLGSAIDSKAGSPAGGFAGQSTLPAVPGQNAQMMGRQEQRPSEKTDFAMKPGMEAGTAATTSPATQPANRLESDHARYASRQLAQIQASAAPASTPALQPAEAAPPATQPTTQPASGGLPATNPSEGPVDLVILVQPNDANASVPATQPAADSAAATAPATQPAR